MPLPYFPATLNESLAKIPRRPGRNFTFIRPDRSTAVYSYEALYQEARARAAALYGLGVRRGDRVALVCPDNDHFVLSFLGACLAGAIPVPIFPRATFKAVAGYVEILAHITATAGARVMVTQTASLPFVEKLKERSDDQAARLALQIVSAEEVFAPERDVPPFDPPDVHPDDVCFLQFTSGSTAKPKGVVVRHRNLVANAQAFLGPAGLDRVDDDVGVSWLPLYHDMGLIGFVLGTLICDIPAVLLPTASFARMPRLWLDTIHAYRGTITYAPNFAYQLVAKRVRDSDLARLDLSGLRVAGCGAEPIRADTLRAFSERLRPAGFDGDRAYLPSYGMAEATLAITFHDLGTPVRIDRVSKEAMKRGSAEAVAADAPAEAVLEIVGCGRSFPGHEVVVRDAAGTPVPERVVGHVTTRGPSVTDGYFENESATKESWKDGWLWTGDLGYFADGQLFLCGREKDLIIIHGANHYPQDIEWVVADLDGVRRGNVATFGVETDTGEALVVVAEAHSSAAAALEAQIASVVSERFGITPHAVLVVPLGTLPKTSSGKLQRRKTKAAYEAGTL